MRSFLSILWLLIVPALCAQDVQKCCGTSNSTFLLGNLSTASHSQCLYLPSDLTNATAGPITRLYYRYGTTGQTTGNTLTGFMVRLTQTSATAFAGGNTFFTGLDTALIRASFTIPPGTTGDWFPIDLDDPFTYDPALTLVVDLSFTGSANTGFGTLSTNLAGRKLYWNDISSPTGQSVVTTWQDIGFDLNAPTGISGPAVSSTMQLFPNPTTGLVHLRSAAPLGPLELRDLTGRTLLRFAPTGPEADLDLRTLPPGSYLLLGVGAGALRVLVE
ncbi:MAG TPA: T9SS type A sorting domain-containing protein [Flavobacteriales bacterium]|nr:T9SS type A sorting domain-containing protein [Flavobacteriales bacterium]HMR28787.1 T9SS type A sorting domain-containing protein [Flavobacteriales bacterium]